LISWSPSLARLLILLACSCMSCSTVDSDTLLPLPEAETDAAQAGTDAVAGTNAGAEGPTTTPENPDPAAGGSSGSATSDESDTDPACTAAQLALCEQERPHTVVACGFDEAGARVCGNIRCQSGWAECNGDPGDGCECTAATAGAAGTAGS